MEKVQRRRAVLKRMGAAALTAGIGGVSAARAQTRVPEIPHPGLNDVAMVTWHQGPLPQLGIASYDGPVILYNPMVLAQLPPALGRFFRAHEYGHVVLQHIQQQMFLGNPFNRTWMSLAHEFQADGYATRSLLQQGDLEAVRMGALFFMGQGPVQLVPTHPPGTARAQNVVLTAQRLGTAL